MLVADVWQRRGLGSLLTDYCLEICRSWGIGRIVAETTTTDNHRMQRIFTNRGFEKKRVDESGEMLFQRVQQTDCPTSNGPQGRASALGSSLPAVGHPLLFQGKIGENMI